MLSGEEREQLLVEWNRTKLEYPASCMQELFEEQVRRSPEAAAVVCEEHELSYAELNRRANQVAHYLRKKGVGPEVLVGICVERGLEMLVGLLGVMKAGGAYVPLDPEYPAERLAYMLEDSGAPVLLTQEKLKMRLPEYGGAVIAVDAQWEQIAGESSANPEKAAGPDTLIYVIYTSGSTGKPKGVGIVHGNVVNFCTAMDSFVPETARKHWLAVTSISFDISFFELLWTLARGFRVELAEPRKLLDSNGPGTAGLKKYRARPMDFSLFYFAADDQLKNNKYRMLLEGAKFADQHNFTAVWTPERHFHAFGGIYPNPAVTGAAIAAVTERIQIRAGSVVLPLQNPLRVAEEWSVVDNLSNGRVGISFASGWQVNDFVLAPERYKDRKEIMMQEIQVVRKLWKGESVTLKGGSGAEVEVHVHPRPIQPDFQCWLTTGGNTETFRAAGEAGANVLTHLLGQSIEELEERIVIYRQAWKAKGHPGRGCVTVMVHAFLGEDLEDVKKKVRKPMCNYLLQAVDLGQEPASQPGLRCLARILAK